MPGPARRAHRPRRGPAPDLPELMRGLRKALASSVSSAEAARSSGGGG
ncbi:hypothetical protein ACWGII_04620 [Streptomyces sp. NPDC054855]